MALRYPPMRELGMGEDLLYRVTRAYLVLLQGYFKENPPGENRMHWSPDAEQTEIWITDQRPVKRTMIERRPAILTQCQAASQFATSQSQYVVGPNLGDEWTTADLLQGAMYLHCISAEGVEARLLAWTVSRVLIVFRRLLHQMGQIHKTAPQIGIGPEQPASSDIIETRPEDFTRVVVTAPFVVQWAAAVTEAPEDPFRIRLRNVESYMETAFGITQIGG